MVIFGLFVNFFGSFLLVAGVVGLFCYFLLILGQMGIFVDWWRGYSRQPSPDLDDDLDEDPARISLDTRALSPDLAGSPDLASPFSRSRWILPERKKTEEEKNISISVLFLYFFFLKKNSLFWRRV
jgi:hypothetical protein